MPTTFKLTVAGKSTAMLVYGRYEATDATSTVDLPTMKAQDIPLTNIKFSPTDASFQFQGGPDLYTFEGIREEGKLTGTVLQGKQPGTFTLVQARPADRASADPSVGGPAPGGDFCPWFRGRNDGRAFGGHRVRGRNSTPRLRP